MDVDLHREKLFIEFYGVKTITLTRRKIRGGGVVGYAPFTLEAQFMHPDKIPVIFPEATQRKHRENLK